MKLAILLLAVVILGATIKACEEHTSSELAVTIPADQELIDIFHDHHRAFDELQLMVNEDTGKISYISDSRVVGTVSSARKQDYRRLLMTLYPHMQLGSSDYNASVRFIFASTDVAALIPGWIKGIEYIPGGIERHGKIVQGLDKAPTLPPGMYLRPIEPRWYIFYQRTEN